MEIEVMVIWKTRGYTRKRKDNEDEICEPTGYEAPTSAGVHTPIPLA